MQDEQPVGPDTLFPSLLANTASHRAITFYVDGQDYDLIVRKVAGTPESFCWAFNRGTRKFIPVRRPPEDAVLDQLIAGGVSASVNIGKYLMLAGNTITPTFTQAKRWDNSENRSYSVVWVRGGAYARTFKITVTTTGGTFTASYTTKTSSYPNLLDTTDIPSTATDYQKQVNDRVNAWNSAATAWIGQAASDITPSNIAAKLAANLTAAGLVGVSSQDGAVLIRNVFVQSITADDGGDDSLIRAVASDVAAPELVSAVHWAGKVVQVRPKRSGGDDTFYLEAVAKDAGATGWTSVYWRECAGVVTMPQSGIVLATVKDGALCIAGTRGGMQGLTGVTDVPGYVPSGVGDDITAPVPYFLGKRIDYLGVFQDRLVIGCDAVLLFSRPGDYFNWFRQSALTVADNDPVEQFALGSEDDRITASANYDRSEVFFGGRYWYSVSGLQPLSPKSNGVVKLRKELKANVIDPQASENLVFYCKQTGDYETKRTKLYQIQAGVLADSPEGTDISTQIDSYIAGTPIEVVPFSTPNTVVLRTTGSRQALYTYAYLDAEQGGQRLFDAWSKWTWSDRTGHAVAVSRDDTEMIVYMIRQGCGQSWIAAERFSFESALSNRPYLDSLRPVSADGTGYFGTGNTLGDDAAAAAGKGGTLQFTGFPYTRIGEFLATPAAAYGWIGIEYDAMLTPTNPYPRDRNGRAITSGRLTLGTVGILLTDTGGMTVSVTANGYTVVSKAFNGRVLGDPVNNIGEQPIATTKISAVIAREIRNCSYTIRSVRWLPMTVTGIDWTGQYFNNTRQL